MDYMKVKSIGICFLARSKDDGEYLIYESLIACLINLREKMGKVL